MAYVDVKKLENDIEHLARKRMVIADLLAVITDESKKKELIELDKQISERLSVLVEWRLKLDD